MTEIPIKLNITFKSLLKEYIIKHELIKKRPKSKYTIDEIVDAIEYILITGASWRSLELDIFKGRYNWESIYHHFKRLSEKRVFEKIYKVLLEKYFKTNESGKLKYLSIDTSFIKNEYASNVAFNGYNKKKRLSKLSMIVDSNGVPLSALLAKGNISDQALFYENIENTYVKITHESNENNKHKRYLLADSAYYTKGIINKVQEINIKPIIWVNKRNTKDPKILKSYKYNKNEIKIYKKE